MLFAIVLFSSPCLVKPLLLLKFEISKFKYFSNPPQFVTKMWLLELTDTKVCNKYAGA